MAVTAPAASASETQRGGQPEIEKVLGAPVAQPARYGVVAGGDPEHLLAVRIFRGLVLPQCLDADPAGVGGVESLYVATTAASEAGSPPFMPGLDDRLGQRPVAEVGVLRAEQRLQRSAHVVERGRLPSRSPTCRSATGSGRESGLPDQRPERGRVSVDELGAQLDRQIRVRRADGVHPAAYPVPGLDRHHAPARRRQSEPRGQAGDTRSDHQDVGISHRGPP